MTGKLVAFAATVVLLGAVPRYRTIAYQAQLVQRPTESLLPASVGRFKAADRWKLPPRGLSGMEQGALYVRGNGEAQKVQVDLYTGNLNSHDALACYLTTGSKIYGRAPRSVQAKDSKPRFEMAFIEGNSIAGANLKMVATTECHDDACGSDRRYSQGLRVANISLARLFAPASRAVPISITLFSTQQAGAEERMQRLFDEFVSDLPFEPFQAYARDQDRNGDSENR